MHTPRWLVGLYSIILVIGTFVALPNFLPKSTMEKLPEWADTSVTLGLDLRGGSELVLQVDSEAMKHERLNTLRDNVRQKLQDIQIQATRSGVTDDTVVVIVPDVEQRQKALAAIKEMVNQITRGYSSTADFAITEQDGKILLTIPQEALDALVSDAVERSIEIIGNRINRYGVTEPLIRRVQADRIQVQLPGVQDPAQVRALLGKTAKMTFRLVYDGNSTALPDSVHMLPQMDKTQPSLPIEDRVLLDGSELGSAEVAKDQLGGNVISFRLKSHGTREFAAITREYRGRALAIILDDEILMAPTIQSVIPDGRGQISMSRDTPLSEIRTNAVLLQAGSLPAQLTVIQERTVGPDLGADAIKMGLYTGIIGFILVAVFIFLLYGFWGLIADIALLLHTLLTFAALSAIQATLTLPGIAGIILGIGIAVDANILINERIREETDKGMGALAALDRGFKHAFHTIVDANVTAVIATLLLYFFGTGAIKGFALTMMLGIIISMFTDITIVRIIMHWAVRRWKIKTLNIHSFFSFMPQHTNFRFMNARYIGVGMSIILSLGALVLFFKPGLNYGLDFKGGIQMEVSNREPLDIEKMRAALGTLDVGEVVLQNVGSNGGIMVRVQQQEGGEAQQTIALERIKQKVMEIYPEAQIPQVEVIGSKISNELAQKGLYAVILATLAMSVYIWWRFEWYFAIGAMATLILDTTKMIGIFVLFQFDFNLTAIAALMTIVGYSINDKVVVYDRMRENLRLFRKTALREIIDMSINQVLIRCIFTSTTTVLAMLPMAIWGGSAVHNFALPLVIGVVIATSSSIFIAAPILLFLGNWWQIHRNKTSGEERATG